MRSYRYGPVEGQQPATPGGFFIEIFMKPLKFGKSASPRIARPYGSDRDDWPRGDSTMSVDKFMRWNLGDLVLDDEPVMSGRGWD